MCNLHLPPPIPPIVEFDRTHNPLRHELLGDEFTLDDSALLVPQGFGLGVTVNDVALKKYSAER
jgi:D-galactarolactone cycloisomerase